MFACLRMRADALATHTAAHATAAPAARSLLLELLACSPSSPCASPSHSVAATASTPAATSAALTQAWFDAAAPLRLAALTALRTGPPSKLIQVRLRVCVRVRAFVLCVCLLWCVRICARVCVHTQVCMCLWVQSFCLRLCWHEGHSHCTDAAPDVVQALHGKSNAQEQQQLHAALVLSLAVSSAGDASLECRAAATAVLEVGAHQGFPCVCDRGSSSLCQSTMTEIAWTQTLSTALPQCADVSATCTHANTRTRACIVQAHEKAHQARTHQSELAQLLSERIPSLRSHTCVHVIRPGKMPSLPLMYAGPAPF